MYKIMNLETRKFYQATKGFDLEVSDKVTAYAIRDDAIEETGQKHIIMVYEDESEPEDDCEVNAFMDWLVNPARKNESAAQLLTAYAR